MRIILLVLCWFFTYILNALSIYPDSSKFKLYVGLALNYTNIIPENSYFITHKTLSNSVGYDITIGSSYRSLDLSISYGQVDVKFKSTTRNISDMRSQYFYDYKFNALTTSLSNQLKLNSRFYITHGISFKNIYLKSANLSFIQEDLIFQTSDTVDKYSVLKNQIAKSRFAIGAVLGCSYSRDKWILSMKTELSKIWKSQKSQSIDVMNYPGGFVLITQLNVAYILL